MNVEELKEGAEHAHNAVQKRISLTMAIVAILLATASLLSHRAHTEEVVLQTKANDQWGFYQAKNIRSHMYAADAKLADLMANGKEVVGDFNKDSEKQKKDAEEIRKEAEGLDKETKVIEHRANYYDTAELFLEVSIVLCSIALLGETKALWQLSMVTTLIGVAVAVYGLVAIH